jgi:hypothetical protein
MPRYHHIRCLTLLGGTLGDWQEAHRCWVETEPIYRITKWWQCDDKDPDVREALDDPQDGLKELRFVHYVICITRTNYLYQGKL